MQKLASLPILIALTVALFPGYASAQDRKLKGRVVGSATNEPLSGVTVKIKGTTTGIATQADGSFSLSVSDTATLVFSFVGYDSQEVPLRSSDSVINVSLRPSDHSLNEVVVIGYGTQKRKDVTSAVATVKPEDFNQGGARNVMDLVQGKVAGLTITRTSGTNPNTSPSIQLRSATSLTG
ncbi:MAG: carboxypeptidase-like regulatory domain-containing protein, partial [Chitinophaga rupis]